MRSSVLSQLNVLFLSSVHSVVLLPQPHVACCDRRPVLAHFSENGKLNTLTLVSLNNKKNECVNESPAVFLQGRTLTDESADFSSSLFYMDPLCKGLAAGCTAPASPFCNIDLIWETCFSQIHTCTVQAGGTHSDSTCTAYTPWFVSGPDSADCSHALGQNIKHYLIVKIQQLLIGLHQKNLSLNPLSVSRFLSIICVCVFILYGTSFVPKRVYQTEHALFHGPLIAAHPHEYDCVFSPAPKGVPPVQNVCLSARAVVRSPFRSHVSELALCLRALLQLTQMCNSRQDKDTNWGLERLHTPDGGLHLVYVKLKGRWKNSVRVKLCPASEARVPRRESVCWHE